MTPDTHRVEMEVQPELDEPSILALPSPQPTEIPQEQAFAFAGDVLLFPESFAHARKQRGSKINPPPVFPHSEQLSLFADLAGVA
jgi:hypothetical protein